MFRKPDEDEDYGSRVVKAKPISEKYAKKLGSAYGGGKDFVTGSSRSQNEFYGHQEVNNEQAPSSAALTEDEKNKIHAKIMKAEMKGDMDLVRKLKRKLDGRDERGPKEKVVVMMKRDRSGNVVPASGKRDDRDRYAQGSSRMNKEYAKDQELEEMVREEKTGSAKDQLRMFERSIVKSAKIKRHDDESVDDIAEMQKVRKKADEKDQRKREKEQRKGGNNMLAPSLSVELSATSKTTISVDTLECATRRIDTGETPAVRVHKLRFPRWERRNLYILLVEEGDPNYIQI